MEGAWQNAIPCILAGPSDIHVYIYMYMYIYIYIYIYKYMQYTNDTHNRGLTFDYTTYTVMEGAWHKATPRIFAGPSDIYVYNIQTTPATEISLSIIQRTQ